MLLCLHVLTNFIIIRILFLVYLIDKTHERKKTKRQRQVKNIKNCCDIYTQINKHSGDTQKTALVLTCVLIIIQNVLVNTIIVNL